MRNESVHLNLIAESFSQSNDLKYPAVESLFEASPVGYIAPFHSNFDCSDSKKKWGNRVYYKFEKHSGNELHVDDDLAFITHDTVFSDFKPYWRWQTLWFRVMPDNKPSTRAASTFSCELTCNRDSTTCFVLFDFRKISEEAFVGNSLFRPNIFIKGAKSGKFSSFAICK